MKTLYNGFCTTCKKDNKEIVSNLKWQLSRGRYLNYLSVCKKCYEEIYENKSE